MSGAKLGVASIPGGWTPAPDFDLSGKMPEQVATGFVEATKGLVGATYTPLIYGGSQIVHGTNYMLICKVAYVTYPEVNHLAKVVINQKPDGTITGGFSLVSIDIII